MVSACYQVAENLSAFVYRASECGPTEQSKLFYASDSTFTDLHRSTLTGPPKRSNRTLADWHSGCIVQRK